MPRKYTIRDGFSFVEADGVVKTGGEKIELEDDVAELHLHKLEPEYSKSELKAVRAQEAADAQAAADKAAAEQAAAEQSAQSNQ